MEKNTSKKSAPNSAYAHTAFVLQGGGALGSYQAGTYESLAEAGIMPDWFTGISIGAINAAIMAGNPPEQRVAKLQAFWDEITATFADYLIPSDSEAARHLHARLSGFYSAAHGVPGFFKPQIGSFIAPFFGHSSISYYDTAPLKQTLLKYVDFDLINKGEVRMSLGSVNISTGNFVYFDNSTTKIRREHIMASGALPPGFPPVEIDGEYYWDGGLVSNTPLSYVLEESTGYGDTLIFQMDLFSATGPHPQTMDDVEERRKDIVYSSRTRLNTTMFHEKHQLRQAIATLSAQLPDSAKKDKNIAALIALGEERKVSVVHLIYRPDHYEGPVKDYEFSNRSMNEHWAAGLSDGRISVKQAAWRTPPPEAAGIALYDYTRTAAKDDKKKPLARSRA